jgi:hypothetical protein
MQNQEQHEAYEKARKRTRQKKRLYWHFILFLVGSVFLILLNEVLDVGKEYGDWFVWVVLIWLFLWIMHFVNVTIFKRFFGKEWERIETEKLVKKHHKKVEILEKKLIDKGVISPNLEKKTSNL